MATGIASCGLRSRCDARRSETLRGVVEVATPVFVARSYRCVGLISNAVEKRIEFSLGCMHDEPYGTQCCGEESPNQETPTSIV